MIRGTGTRARRAPAGVQPHTPGEANGSAEGVSERRLVRLGFDLHDGALQGVVGLAADLRLFREQLASVLDGGHRPILLGRVDDLEARLVEVERELRELAQSFEPRSLLERPFVDVLRDEVDSFAARSEVDTALKLDGEFTELSASQRLALLRVVQEGLTNAREHGGAGRAGVSVSESPDGVLLEVWDDGRGFDVDEALEHAEEHGRLGLSGMHQRVAMLGGELAVHSRPGGPTVISARLPRWRPGDSSPA